MHAAILLEQELEETKQRQSWEDTDYESTSSVPDQLRPFLRLDPLPGNIPLLPLYWLLKWARTWSTAARAWLQEPMEVKQCTIAVVGVTGSGKSSFIKRLAGDTSIKIGNTLTSETSEITLYTFTYNLVKYTLLDTPGFNDTTLSDHEIFQTLIKYLAGTKLNGILYLHRITDTRMQGSALRNLTMFRKLCGEDCFKDIVLGTTHWDAVENDIGVKREKELVETEEFWGEMVGRGSRVMRAGLDRDSNLELLQSIRSNVNAVMGWRAEEEMAEEGFYIEPTDAFWSTEELVEVEELRREFEMMENEGGERRARLLRDADEGAKMLTRMRREELREIEEVQKRKVEEVAEELRVKEEAAESRRRARLAEERIRRQEVLAEQRRVEEERRKLYAGPSPRTGLDPSIIPEVKTARKSIHQVAATAQRGDETNPSITSNPRTRRSKLRNQRRAVVPEEGEEPPEQPHPNRVYVGNVDDPSLGNQLSNSPLIVDATLVPESTREILSGRATPAQNLRTTSWDRADSEFEADETMSAAEARLHAAGWSPMDNMNGSELEGNVPYEYDDDDYNYFAETGYGTNENKITNEATAVKPIPKTRQLDGELESENSQDSILNPWAMPMNLTPKIVRTKRKPPNGGLLGTLRGYRDPKQPSKFEAALKKYEERRRRRLAILRIGAEESTADVLREAGQEQELALTRKGRHGPSRGMLSSPLESIAASQPPTLTSKRSPPQNIGSKGASMGLPNNMHLFPFASEPNLDPPTDSAILAVLNKYTSSNLPIPRFEASKRGVRVPKVLGSGPPIQRILALQVDDLISDKANIEAWERGKELLRNASPEAATQHIQSLAETSPLDDEEEEILPMPILKKRLNRRRMNRRRRLLVTIQKRRLLVYRVVSKQNGWKKIQGIE
ncbi:uncharacterized protein PAC_14878 [Phialocephala subalpina]|uniref:G domain-containing protein n=1 Tax=Phialocephala subalpina TaxID=576137 RepID=A0A1L7XIY4_9HELO|nr:uncharacterized protein PAC_14878 [Phialocephala subalpina]